MKHSLKLALSLSCGGDGEGVVDSEESHHLNINVRRRKPRRGENGVYECKTCRRKFPSFQALGGHRTSHLRPNISRPPLRGWKLKPSVHKCAVCGVGFPMGQALGGHMRRHRSSAGGGGGAIQDEQIDSISSGLGRIENNRSEDHRMIGNGCGVHDLILLELFK